MLTTDDDYTVLLRRARLHAQFMRLLGEMIELTEQVKLNKANYLALKRCQDNCVVSAEANTAESNFLPFNR